MGDEMLPKMLLSLLIILKVFGSTEASCSISGSYADCYYLDLTSVPQNLPANITTLDVKINLITTLSQSDFQSYGSLTHLDLSQNRIDTINGQAFYYLSDLINLDLEENRLSNIIHVHEVTTTGTMARTTSLLPMAGPANKPDSRSSHESAPTLSIPVLIGSVCGPVAVTLLVSTIILTIWFKSKTQNPALGPTPPVGFSNASSVSVTIRGHDQTGQGGAQAASESSKDA
uniref:LRRNT domain-containing protein n=1 Tax=Branchiostoma floridae TaxID=7739 RepID=C3YAB2_BRAFL|eukprot:XP_002606650.1 hypothetical protein BRAFLDRAFT_91743 [Branchiostoma floridae]